MPRRQPWSYSFRSDDFNGADRKRKPGRHPAPAEPAPPAGDGQHECPRGPLCASSTRDDDGVWHPLMVNSAFCPADEAAIVNALPGLPRSWEALAARMTDPLRSGTPGPRRPPGPRVPLSPEDDALLRESAQVLMSWAARVRAVPGLSLSPRTRLPFSAEGVAESCRVLARHATQLLALPPGPMFRTWAYLPGRASPPPPPPPVFRVRAPVIDSPPTAAAPCRRCSVPVSRSPSGRYWWPAVCCHPAAVEVGDPGAPEPRGLACAACCLPLPPGFEPARPAPCAHEPSSVRPAEPAPPAAGGRRGLRRWEDIEDEIADLEVIRIGDGWVICSTTLSGIDAGLDVLDLSARFRRALQEAPARPEALDVPCDMCEEIKLVEAEPPHDPNAEKDKSRCTNCGARMSAERYAQWAKMYDAWVRRAGPLVCKFCQDGAHGACWWASCECRRAGHPAAA